MLCRNVQPECAGLWRRDACPPERNWRANRCDQVHGNKPWKAVSHYRVVWQHSYGISFWTNFVNPNFSWNKFSWLETNFNCGGLVLCIMSWGLSQMYVVIRWSKSVFKVNPPPKKKKKKKTQFCGSTQCFHISKISFLNWTLKFPWIYCNFLRLKNGSTALVRCPWMCTIYTTWMPF